MRNAPRPRRAAHAGIVAQGRPFFGDEIAGGGGEGVGEGPVRPARPTAGLRRDQSIQGVVAEGLGLCASGLEILDPIDVAHRVVVIFEALQGSQVGWDAGLQGLQPAPLLVPGEVAPGLILSSGLETRSGAPRERTSSLPAAS